MEETTTKGSDNRDFLDQEWAGYVSSILAQYCPVIESFRRDLKTYSSLLSEQYTQLSKIPEEFFKYVSQWQNELEGIRENLSRIFAIEEKVIEMGHLGWTAIPGENFEVYLNYPSDRNAVDKLFLESLSETVVENLFDELLDITDELDDTCEAIANYKESRYKSCVLLLFGLIDSILIKSQTVSMKSRRKTGEGASKSVFENLKKNLPASFHYYQLIGVDSCLLTVFQNGEDFQNEGPVVNRNFLNHGMSRRKVTKKDSLQLFLLYRNLFKLVKDINDEFGGLK